MVRRLFAWCVICSLAACGASAPRPGVDAPAFGSQIVWPSDPNLAGYADQLQSAQVGWARSELIWWGLCEQSPGQYRYRVDNWDCDNWLGVLKARGIRPYCILCYGNPLYGGTPNTPAGRAAFAAFCRETVGRYRDQVDVWVIWNEPNLEQFWGAPPKRGRLCSAGRGGGSCHPQRGPRLTDCRRSHRGD